MRKVKKGLYPIKVTIHGIGAVLYEAEVQVDSITAGLCTSCVMCDSSKG
jgi:hypothetical protein